MTEAIRRIPFVQLKVTILEDADLAALMSREGGAAAFGIFTLLLADARRKRNGGHFTGSLASIAAMLYTTRQAIEDAVRLIGEACAENGTAPWVTISDGSLTIRSFEKYQGGRGGARDGSGRKPIESANQSNANQTKSNGNQTKSNGRFDYGLIHTQNPESRIQKPEARPQNPPTPLAPQGGDVQVSGDVVVHSPEADIGWFTDADVTKILAEWQRVRGESPDHARNRNLVIGALTNIANTRYDEISRADVIAAGGPGPWLLGVVRAYADSGQVRRGFPCKIGKFFSGYEPVFLEDPAGWSDAKAEDPGKRAMDDLMEIARRSGTQ